jgi:hypothetical protein
MTRLAGIRENPDIGFPPAFDISHGPIKTKDAGHKSSLK